MTVKELIDKVREEKPNSFTDAKLYEHINEIEADVAEKLHKAFTKYVSPTDNTKELILPAAHTEVYVSYLKAKIDWDNEESASYQNNYALYLAEWNAFVDWAVREKKIEVMDGERIVTRFRNVF